MHIETEYNRENRVGTQIWISDDGTTQTIHSHLAATNQSNTNYDQRKFRGRNFRVTDF